MSKRIVIVGGVAAGASAAAKARRTSEDVEIVLCEAGPYISFANCGLPYYVGGEIAKRDDLFVVNPKAFARRFNVEVRVNTRVTAVQRDSRAVVVEGPDGAGDEIAYDRLVLATGAVGIRPPIKGLLGRENIFTVRTVLDVDLISAFLSRPGSGDAPRAVVIGAGYIGLEIAEQLLRRGLKVTVVEMAGQVMPAAMDGEMAAPLQKALEVAGCEVILSDAVSEIVERDGASAVVTRSGRELPLEIGILAVGVKPNVELAVSAGLQLGQTGAIKVDRLQRTSDPTVYAAGDNSETTHLVTGKAVNIPLAGSANKAGRAAGANAALDLAGAGDGDPRRLSLRGVLGTAIVRVCDQAAGVTGLTEAQATREGIDFEVIYMPGLSHAGYYPGAARLLLKILYDRRSGRLIGAQAVGADGVDKRLDVLATAIAGEMTIEDLEQLDLCYAPPFGSARDVVILAGFAGSNTRRGIMPAITPARLLDELAGDSPPVVLDVRAKDEWDAGHLEGAIHVPVDELRSRIDEVPADRPVTVHCAAGYRSYVAQRILMNSARDNVRNILGGYPLIKQLEQLRK